MGLKAPRLSSILFAVVFALSCFGFTLFVWKSFGGPTPFEAHGYRFHVLFGSEASQLSPNAQVRIAGVPVGKVIAVKRRGLGADALLELESRYAPVPADARAIMRYKTLLGETFVELTPGTRAASKLAENGTLAPANVGDVQQIDRVLGSFDAPTRLAFKRFLQGTAKALDARGADINAALGHLAPTSEDVATIAEIADAQRPALRALLRDAGVTLRAIGADDDALRSLVTAGDDVFGATAARNRELTATVRALPPLLSELRAFMGQVEGVSRDARPVLAALEPAIALVRPALEETSRLAPELRRTFTALDPAISAGRTGLPALNRVLDTAQPLLRVLYPAGRELVPVVQLLTAYKAELVAQAAKLGASTQFQIPNGDGTSRHVLRTLIPITNESLNSASQRLPSNRHNPYPEPRALDYFTNGGLRALDCANTSNPQDVPVLGSGAPPCVVQQPWEFQGVRRSFPHVERDNP